MHYIDFKLPKEMPKCPSVVKLTCSSGRYIILKTMNLEFLRVELFKMYGRYHRNGVAETHFLFPLIKHIGRMDHPKIKVDVLFESDNGYDVLKSELDQLAEHFGNKDCLNTNNVPYIPKTQHAKSGSRWLTQNQALNFRKLLKKYSY